MESIENPEPFIVIENHYKYGSSRIVQLTTETDLRRYLQSRSDGEIDDEEAMEENLDCVIEHAYEIGKRNLQDQLGSGIKFVLRGHLVGCRPMDVSADFRTLTIEESQECRAKMEES